MRIGAVNVPYLVWNDGKPRWMPGPAVRARGWRGKALKDASGKWLPLADAVKEAKRLNAESGDAEK